MSNRTTAVCGNDPHPFKMDRSESLLFVRKRFDGFYLTSTRNFLLALYVFYKLTCFLAQVLILQ